MSIVDKVKQMLGQHSDKARQGVERAGDMVDQRTGGKYSDKVDKAQEKAGGYIDQQSRAGGEPVPEQGAGDPHSGDENVTYRETTNETANRDETGQGGTGPAGMEDQDPHRHSGGA